jgi:hypothetical protein
MNNQLFSCCFVLLLFFCCTTEIVADPDFHLDERYADNGSKNGNHTIVFFNGNLSTPNEIRKPLLRGFEQAHIIANPSDNLIVLFISSRMDMTLFFSEREYYLSFLNGVISEEEFIQYVSNKYIIQ